MRSFLIAGLQTFVCVVNLSKSTCAFQRVQFVIEWISLAILLYLFNELLVFISWFLIPFILEFGDFFAFDEVLFDYWWIQSFVNKIYALKLNDPCPLWIYKSSYYLLVYLLLCGSPCYSCNACLAFNLNTVSIHGRHWSMQTLEKYEYLATLFRIIGAFLPNFSEYRKRGEFLILS